MTTDSPTMSAASDPLVLAQQRGAQTMLDALIATGVIYLDLPNRAVRPGKPVGIEVLDKELSVRGIRR